MSGGTNDEVDVADVTTQVERLLDVERPADARRVLAPALLRHPDDADLLVLAARVEDDAEDKVEARRLIGEALRREPDHFGGRIYHYRHLAADQRHAEAEEVILGLLREAPASAPLIALYAQLMLETMHLEKARALVDEALRLDPEEGLAQVLDVLLAVVHDHSAAARDRLMQMVAQRPDARHVAYVAITVLADRHDDRAALELARALVKGSPNDQAAIDIAVELRARTHPLSWPIWPMQRFGWYGSAAIWVVGVGGLQLARQLAPSIVGPLLVAFLGWVIYSWTVPPLLRQHLKKRGIA